MVADVEQAVIGHGTEVEFPAGERHLADGLTAGVGFHDGRLGAGVVSGRVVGEACVGKPVSVWGWACWGRRRRGARRRRWTGGRRRSFFSGLEEGYIGGPGLTAATVHVCEVQCLRTKFARRADFRDVE